MYLRTAFYFYGKYRPIEACLALVDDTSYWFNKDTKKGLEATSAATEQAEVLPNDADDIREELRKALKEVGLLL